MKTLEEAIHSIFGFIELTAEKAEHGTTWTTINYENKPQHDISVFNGVGGIPFFLTDYHRCYKESVPAGYAWPTDSKGLYSADFDYGASGVGHFLLRVCSEEPLPMPLM